jgi:hypothetical protein
MSPFSEETAGRSVDSAHAERGPSGDGERPSRLERFGEHASRLGSLRPADPNLRRALYTAVGLVLALAVTLAIFAGIEKLPDLKGRFEPVWMIVGVVGFFCVTLVAALLWQRILVALGPSLRPRSAVTIWCASALGRYVPTSVLQPVMRMAMAEREGVAKRICLASLMYELTFGFTAALIIGVYWLLDLPALRGEPLRFVVLGVPALGIVLLQPVVFGWLANKLLTRLGRREMPWALSERRVAGFLAGYVLFYILAGLCVYALVRAVYPIGSADLVLIVGSFAASTAVSLVAFIFPSGLLAREAVFVVAVSSAIPTTSAIAIALLVRVVQIGAEVVLAVGIPLIMRLRAPLAAPIGRPAE